MLITISLILLSIIYINTQYLAPCDCGDKQSFDIIRWKCIDYPTEVSQGWIKNCVSYYVNQGQLVCNQCNSQYFLESFQDSRQYCLKTKIKNCKLVQADYQDQYGNPLPYCKKCDEGYFLNNDDSGCIKLFEPSDEQYIENCISYINIYQNIYDCTNCKQGYYVSDNMGKCIKNPDPICLQYKSSRNGLICQKCKSSYFIDKDNQCKLAYNFIRNCHKGVYYRYQKPQYQCEECVEGYYLSYNQTQCFQNPLIGEHGYIRHCKIYQIDSQNNLTCSQCHNDKYSLTEDRKYCNLLKDSSFVNNCELYEDMDGFQGCYQCQDGYQRNKFFQPYNYCRKCPTQQKNVSQYQLS